MDTINILSCFFLVSTCVLMMPITWEEVTALEILVVLCFCHNLEGVFCKVITKLNLVCRARDNCFTKWNTVGHSNCPPVCRRPLFILKHGNPSFASHLQAFAPHEFLKYRKICLLFYKLFQCLRKSFWTYQIHVISMFVVRYTAIAVASFGHKYVSRCGRWPGGFARLTPAVLSWIYMSTSGKIYIHLW